MDESNVPVQRVPINWPLELGETLIVYHPHAKRTPEVIPTRELAAASISSEDPLPSWDADPTRPPYFPFKSLADFEQTELFVRDDHTDGGINRQLDLWRCHAPGTGVMLKNAREMHQRLEAAGLEEDISQVMFSDIILHDIQLTSQPGV